jgi:hypothetical protein
MKSCHLTKINFFNPFSLKWDGFFRINLEGNGGK